MKDGESKDYYAIRFLSDGALMTASPSGTDPRLFDNLDEAHRFGKMSGVGYEPVSVTLTVHSPFR